MVLCYYHWSSQRNSLHSYQFLFPLLLVLPDHLLVFSFPVGSCWEDFTLFPWITWKWLFYLDLSWYSPKANNFWFYKARSIHRKAMFVRDKGKTLLHLQLRLHSKQSVGIVSKKYQKLLHTHCHRSY